MMGSLSDMEWEEVLYPQHYVLIHFSSIASTQHYLLAPAHHTLPTQTGRIYHERACARHMLSSRPLHKAPQHHRRPLWLTLNLVFNLLRFVHRHGCSESYP